MISDKYEIQKVLGQGSFGEVRQAKCKATGIVCAVKLIMNCMDDSYQLRKVYREMIILRKLTGMSNNIFWTNLIEIIIPEGQEQDIKCIFFVMESMQSDMK